MKTKPHQTRDHIYDSASEAEFHKPAPSISAQKPKGANQLGPLRNHLAPLGFCFKNNDALSSAFPAAASTGDIDSKTKGCHLPPEKVATFEKVGILSFLS